MSAYRALDLFELDALLTEEERLVRDTARSFVSERVLPVIERHFEQGSFPMDLIPQMAELGFFGANLEGYGCAGLGAVAYGLIMQELERGDSGVRSCASVQGSLCMYPIYAYGSEEQKERWLPRMAAGEVIGCFGLTEPDHGSDPGSMQTRARRTAGGWVLNGTKRWITNGSIADLAVVWARTGEDASSIRGFLVEKGTPGFSAPQIERKWSLRASVTSDLILEDVEVPDSAMLPGVQGLRGPLSCLNQARYGIAWGAIGAMQACFDEALRYATARTQFGRPIAGFQLTQHKLCEMASEITKAQLLALRLGRLKEQGRAQPWQISLAKRNNVYWALEIARTARQILGASGITHEYQCGRHAANLESVITYEGTHEIHTLIVGKQLTGLDAFQ
ncbi:MAG: acyl-CoA dehydrogenase [Planctomycetota bacterium]|nr:MAG: acyl-CoA dehydrogenase [Planctomycetota bacterium]